MKGKGLSVRAALLSAITGAVTLVAFMIYGIAYDYLDYVVALSLAAGILCIAAYAFVNSRMVMFLNLVSVVITAYGMGLFFLNSHPVWADRLNHIEMYGSRGTLVPVVLILVLFVVTLVLGIVSCYSAKEV